MPSFQHLTATQLTDETFSLDVTVNYETRPVVFRLYPASSNGTALGRASNIGAVLGRTKSGAKLHPMYLMAWQNEDGTWHVNMVDRVRNNCVAYAAAWADPKYDSYRAHWFPGGAALRTSK